MPVTVREGQAIVFLFIVCQPPFVSYLLFLYFENLPWKPNQWLLTEGYHVFLLCFSVVNLCSTFKIWVIQKNSKNVQQSSKFLQSKKSVNYHSYKEIVFFSGNSLAFQWLGLGTFTAGPGQRTKIPPCGVWHGQKKKK